MNDAILSTLIGLCGACENNGKTVHTDSIVSKALLTCLDNETDTALIKQLTEEKYTISPSCKTCATPCGKTSDFDMARFYQNDTLVEVKIKLLKEMQALIKRLQSHNQTKLPIEIYRGISYLSYDLSMDSYTDLIKTLQSMT